MPLLGSSVKSNQVAPVPDAPAAPQLGTRRDFYLPPVKPAPPQILVPAASQQHPLQSPAVTPSAAPPAAPPTQAPAVAAAPNAPPSVKFALPAVDVTTTSDLKDSLAASSTGGGPTTPGGTKKLMVQPSEVLHGSDQRVEVYIPFRLADLREQLYEDFEAEVFQNPDTQVGGRGLAGGRHMRVRSCVRSLYPMDPLPFQSINNQ